MPVTGQLKKCDNGRESIELALAEFDYIPSVPSQTILILESDYNSLVNDIESVFPLSGKAIRCNEFASLNMYGVRVEKFMDLFDMCVRAAELMSVGVNVLMVRGGGEG